MLSYRPARLHRLAEGIHSLKSIPGLHKRLKILALSWFLFHGMFRNGIPRAYFYFLLHGKEFRGVVSSAEWFGKEFRKFFVPRNEINEIPSCVLFRRRVRNIILGVCFYFCSTERDSELFSLPRKGSERNSEFFCSAEQPEFRRK
jgi:hypothetical protein